MGTKANGTNSERTYDEFEPFCSWQREEGRDVLELHLPEFKKEQLKVRINSLRVLLITGERPVSANKWSRFCKEIQIPSNANANEIRAKFSGAKLIITMPKVPPPNSSAQYQESNKRPNQDNFNYSNNEAAMLSKVSDSGPNMATEVGGTASGLMMSRRRMSKRTAVAVAVAALAAGVAVGVYVAYKYCWS